MSTIIQTISSNNLEKNSSNEEKRIDELNHMILFTSDM